MKISIEAFVEKLDGFFLKDVIPAAQAMTTKFAVGFARPLALTAARQKLTALSAAGLLGDEPGMVETSILKECMTSAFDAGGAPSVLGLRLERSDVDRFFKGIEG